MKKAIRLVTRCKQETCGNVKNTQKHDKKQPNNGKSNAQLHMEQNNLPFLPRNPDSLQKKNKSHDKQPQNPTLVSKTAEKC